MMREILAVIPARGGSKGLPMKNIALLNGRPLIDYSIKAALNSRHVNRIVVSTDSAEISDVSKRCGAEVINRPESLARDDSPTISAVIHALGKFEAEGYVPEAVILLQPTSPLRTFNDVDSALELFFQEECESVISVCEIEHSPYWSFKAEKKYIEPLFDEKYLKMRRQELPMVYIPCGAIFISRPETLFTAKSFYSSKTLPYIMPRERSIDIDSMFDLMEADLILKG
jgi:N-acylneuraminate cytidylyltransferase